MKHTFNATTTNFITKVMRNTKRELASGYSWLLSEFSETLEEFLFQSMQLSYISSTRRNLLITSMDSKMERIDVLPLYRRNIYGECENKVVYINPDIPKNKRKLYIFHEFAHMLVALFNIDEITEELNNSNRKYHFPPHLNGSARGLIRTGWLVIEEAIVQNIAENCYYSSIGCIRPAMTVQEDPRVLGNIRFKSNYDYYGLYQILVTAFARTLRGIGKSPIDSDITIIDEFSKKATNCDIRKHIINEYEHDGLILQLYEVLRIFGIIWHNKAASFGVSQSVTSITDTQKMWYEILNKLKGMEDYRKEI